MSKYYIVGSGITGSVLARELAEKGHDVILWERRNHVGGNLYDFIDEYGIRVHLYGPHIFHTEIERVWKYVNRFCQWEDYNLVCGSVIDGKCVPTSFDYEAIDTFFPNEAERIKRHIQKEFGDRKCATVLEMLDSQDGYVQKYAQFLYDKDYAPYTAKQWGIQPNEVDRDVLKRVPILFSYGSRYFDDLYQAMPVNGYMEMINNLLDHKNIRIETNINALDHLEIKGEKVCINKTGVPEKVIYTGPIDELFKFEYGKLPYRSLRFEWKHEMVDSFQKMPVVAYPQAAEYTRITEYKKLPFQNVHGTTYAVEYPLRYEVGTGSEPYYPVLTDASKLLFCKYEGLAKKIKNLICCGRLADFKYYNMDMAIDRALTVAEQICN